MTTPANTPRSQHRMGRRDELSADNPGWRDAAIADRKPEFAHPIRVDALSRAGLSAVADRGR
jgi:hypothetical protein